MLNVTKLIALFGLIANISTASASENSFQPVQKEGFLFKFQKCQVTPNSNMAMICSFLVENSNPARQSLVLYPGKSQFADSDGNVVTSTGIQIGNNAFNSSKAISDELIQGIPVKGKIIFSKAPQGNIRLIDIFCTIGETIDRNNITREPIDLTLFPDEFNVEFRF